MFEYASRDKRPRGSRRKEVSIPRYRHVLPAQAGCGALSQDLAERLEGLASLRDILVRDYVEVDSTHLWVLIETKLDHLRAAHDAAAAIPELDGAPAGSCIPHGAPVRHPG